MKQLSFKVQLNLTYVFILACILVAYLLNMNPDSFKDELILLVIPVVVINFLLIDRQLFKTIQNINEFIDEIKTGNFSQEIKIKVSNEFKPIVEGIRRLVRSISNAADFIKNIENGNLEAEYTAVLTEESEVDPLEENLLSMRDQMKTIAEEDRQRNWTSDGLAKFIDLLRADNNDLKLLSDAIISNLVKYVNANQGGLFIVKNKDYVDAREAELELIACYAYERKKHVEKEVRCGEGLVGQAFIEGDTIYMTDIPKGYVNITSGLGEACPCNILIVPLKVNEEIYGIVELASFYKFEKYMIEFVEKLGENIASTISGVKANAQTKILLKESQQQTEELRAQEEEMRQNQEEMMATQEALERKQSELAESEKKSTAIFENSVDAIIVADEHGLIESANKAASDLFKLPEINNEISDEQHYLQSIINKFDPNKPDILLNRRKRTKGTTVLGKTVSIEIYMLKVEIGSKSQYMAYLRCIDKEIDKERQIAESLMEMDQLKSELNKLKIERKDVEVA